VAEQARVIERLEARIAEQDAEIAELKRCLGQDPSNSSKPPPSSSDLPFVKPAPKRSSRTVSGRRRGRQDGTPGTTLRLVEDPDETVRHEPTACSGCGAHLAGAPVFDAPPAPPRPHTRT
jgi:transposase